MEAHKVVLVFVDHDGIGPEGAKSVLESARYPNRCMRPQVLEVQTRDIGEWEDAHPLNKVDPEMKAWRNLFASKADPEQPPKAQEGEAETPHEQILRAEMEHQRERAEAYLAKVESLEAEVKQTRAGLNSIITITQHRAEKAEAEVAQYRADLRAAAGECLVPMPLPGTDMAKVLAANSLMRARLRSQEAGAALEALCERVERGRRLVQEMCDSMPGGPWSRENNNWGIFDTTAERALLGAGGEGPAPCDHEWVRLRDTEVTEGLQACPKCYALGTPEGHVMAVVPLDRWRLPGGAGGDRGVGGGV